VLVAQKVAAGVYKGVTTSELDELAAETAAALTSSHPDYAVVRSWVVLLLLLLFCCCCLWGVAAAGFGVCFCLDKGQCERAHHQTPRPPPPKKQLAARIAVSNLHKNTLKSFTET
jgi:predicted lysophospholipase L1 biosynthesis ABC-type transport system permease subunit